MLLFIKVTIIILLQNKFKKGIFAKYKIEDVNNRGWLVITALSSVKEKHVKISSKKQVTNKNDFSAKATSFGDSFTKSDKLTFKGKQYASGYYEDDEIEIAKRFINQKGTDWKNTIRQESKKGFSELFDESNGIFHALGPFDQCDGSFARVTIAICTLGASEVVMSPITGTEMAIRNSKHKKAVEKKIQRISTLIPDIVAEQLQGEQKATLAVSEKALEKVKHTEEVQKLKNQLKEAFSDRVNMEKRNEPVKMPNCIMLVDEHDDLSKELVNWIGENSECNFKKLADSNKDTLQETLADTLDEAKETFDKTKIRTLIAVEDFGDLITPEKNKLANIEGLKKIMNTCANAGATIIFREKNPSRLNSEAIQPHRVASIIKVAIKSLK